MFINDIYVDKNGKRIPTNTRLYADIALEQGHDGVIFKNMVDTGLYASSSEEVPSTVAVVFSSNQIKSVDNVSPTENDDIRFSLSVDSEGRELTGAQQRYFVDSKIRDDQGRLKVMHHGSSAYGFDIFDIKKAKSSGLYGRGFYFSEDNSHAGQYGKTYNVYLNIVDPLTPGNNTITKDMLRKFVDAVANDEDYGIDNYGYDASPASVTDNVWGKDDFAMIQDINAACVGDFVAAVKLFNDVNGTTYDGIVA